MGRCFLFVGVRRFCVLSLLVGVGCLLLFIVGRCFLLVVVSRCRCSWCVVCSGLLRVARLLCLDWCLLLGVCCCVLFVGVCCVCVLLHVCC